MLAITCLQDLQQFGIFPLTGEADNLSYRILCDISRQGRDLLREVYAMNPDANPWNNSTDGQKHVASVMLSYRAWQDIAPVALQIKCHTILGLDNGTVIGLEKIEAYQQAEYNGDSDETPLPMVRCDQWTQDSGKTWQNWPTCYGKVERFFGSSNNPHVGTRN